MSGVRPLVLVTRPSDEAEALADRLKRGGYDALIAPMLRIEREERLRAADLSGLQAVALTSARSAHAAAEDIEREALSGVSAFCVGDATARAAEAAGFGAVRSAEGAARDLIALLIRELEPAKGPVAILRGRDAAVDLAPPLESAGFAVVSHRLYRAEPAKDLPREVVDAFVENRVAAVLLLSKRTAKRFGELFDARLGGDASGPALAVCISEDVAEAARMARFRRCIAAETPDLLTTLRALDAALGGSVGHTERLC